MNKVISLIIFLINIMIVIPQEDISDQLSKLITANLSQDKILEWCKNSKAILNFKDIIKFSQLGLNEDVINCLLKNASENPQDTGIIKYENGSFWIAENIRCYFKKSQNKLTLVITNLDENGKRIGGEVPYEEQLAEKRYWEEKRAAEAEELSRTIAPKYIEQSYVQEPPKQAVIDYVSVPTYTMPYGYFVPYNPLSFYLPYIKAPSFYNNCFDFSNCNFNIINEKQDNIPPSINNKIHRRNITGPNAFPLGIKNPIPRRR